MSSTIFRPGYHISSNNICNVQQFKQLEDSFCHNDCKINKSKVSIASLHKYDYFCYDTAFVCICWINVAEKVH